LEIFLGELTQYIAELSDPAVADVAAYLAEISHALKSSAASFGAEALCAYSIEVDAMAKSGNAMELDLVQPKMVSLLSETKQRYQQLMAEL
jgi:two-component system phosphorelay protein LuxU